MAAIRECLACEQSFDPADYELQQVEVKFKDQYCSKSCQDSYESYLVNSSVLESSEIGNLTAAGLDKRIDASKATLDSLISQFRKKDQTK